MRTVNKQILLGCVGKDPEVKQLPSSKTVVTVVLATNYQYKRADGEKIEETDWHTVVFFGGLAEIAQRYVRKGRTIYVEGRTRKNRHAGEDGVVKYYSDVIAEDLVLIGGYGESKNEKTKPTEKQEDHDEVPF